MPATKTIVPKLKENYVRNGNPTLWQTEEAIAALEGGPEALLFASGMAAITTLTETIPQGAHVVAPDVMYYGTRDWLKRLEGLGRISLTLFDPRQDRERLAAALQQGKTDLVWIETPLNPTWDVIDIEAAAKAAHEAGAILAVDATATGAVTTQPLKLGADIVFHSATKYLNGHSDVLAGVLVTREVNQRWKDVAMLRTKMGAPLGAARMLPADAGHAHRVRALSAVVRPMPWPSRGISRSIRRWSGCSIRALPRIRAMTLPRSR